MQTQITVGNQKARMVRDGSWAYADPAYPCSVHLFPAMYGTTKSGVVMELQPRIVAYNLPGTELWFMRIGRGKNLEFVLTEDYEGTVESYAYGGM